MGIGRIGVHTLINQNIIDDALAQDCLIINSAVNHGDTTNTRQTPSLYNVVFVVASVDHDDKKASSSAFQNYVSISAPGKIFGVQYMAINIVINQVLLCLLLLFLGQQLLP